MRPTQNNRIESMKNAFGVAMDKQRKAYQTVISGTTTAKPNSSKLPQFKNVYDMPALGTGAADGTFRR